MKRFGTKTLMLAGLAVAGMTGASHAADLQLGTINWDVAGADVGSTAGNILYGNAFSADGLDILGGSVNGSLFKINASTGNVEEDVVVPGSNGARAAIEIGGTIYFGGDDAQGIDSITDSSPWPTPTGSFSLAAEGSEAITTDGTSIFVNVDQPNPGGRDEIRKYNTSFSLDTGFDGDGIVELGSGRVRGISYYDGYIFASTSGGGAGDLFAIDSTTGATTNLGTAPNGIQQLSAGSLNGQDFLVGVDGSNLFVWDLDLSGTPAISAQDTYNTGDLTGIFGIGNGYNSGNFLGSVWIDTNNDQLILGQGFTNAVFAASTTLIPEPASLALLGLGGLLLAGRRRAAQNA